MVKRARAKLETKPSSYFVSDKANIQFISSGCTLLDCALGRGYPLGRVVNIVGDKSACKTALATEALTNFLSSYPKGAAAYRETEAAFDEQYAQAMGLPIANVDFGDLDNPLTTVEDFYRDFDKFLDQQLKAKQPGIYVLDSLDALSDEAEMANDISKGTFGAAKAKKLSEFFRKSARKQERANVLLIIVSQVRDNIGAMIFGDKHKRSGGRALDFYSSIVLWLAHIKTLKKTISKVERPYGVLIKASVKKNKVALPFRNAEFSFLFGYGVEDLGASIEWLNEVGRLKDINLSVSDVKTYLKGIEAMPDDEYRKEQALVTPVVLMVWNEIETTFLPKRSKYG